ncbi:hypothetical protein TB2_004792 [Malus domestica]
MDFHKFQKEHLDAVFVPPGVLMMLIYHLLLLRKYLMQPLSTAIGYENKDKKELGWQTSARATMRIDVKKAKRAVQRGSEFWSLGLRALYFVLNFLLWFFRAIPMLASSSVTVLILSCHEFKKPDTNQLVFAL